MVALEPLLKVWSTEHRSTRRAGQNAAAWVSPTPARSDTLDKRPGNLHFNKCPKPFVDETTQTPEFSYGNFLWQGTRGSKFAGRVRQRI